MSGKLRLDLIHIGIDGSHSHDVHHVANRSAEIDEVDRLVQSHLDRADNLSIGAQHLQHLVGRACGSQVGEYQRVDIQSLQTSERIFLVSEFLVEGEAQLHLTVDGQFGIELLHALYGVLHLLGTVALV